MDYPAPLPSGRNWRTTAFLAAGVAVLELVVLVVLALAAFGLPFAQEREAQLRAANGEAAAKVSPSKPATDGRAVPATQARSETSVVVLNGNGVPGAADLASVEVRGLRYILTGTGNAPHSDFARTLVMYRPGFEGEAHRLARDVRAKRVVPLDGMRSSALMGAQIALILGRK